MTREFRWIAVWACLVLLGSQVAEAQFGNRRGKSKPKAKVDLVSSVESVVPGVPFEVGIRFRLVRGWHIYWQNSGDSGLPPRAKWDLPTGFNAGELQFPVPERHVAAEEIVTNIHEGEPVLLVTITPPADIAGRTVKLSAEVTHLVCQKQCLREQNSVSLELPVAAKGSTPKPANQDLFARARAALPHAKSENVAVRASVSAEKLKPGTKFDLQVEVDIARGFVVPARTDIRQEGHGLDVFVNRVGGVYYERPVFPAGSDRNLAGLGSVPVYAGRATIRVPAEADEDIANGPVTLAGLLKFQPCDEGGKCLPEEAVTFAVTVGAPAGAKLGAAADTAGGSETLATDRSASPADGTAGVTTTSKSGSGIEETLKQWGLWGLLLGCFLYGLFINATPCVLPLLSIKVLGFVQQAHESRRRTLLLGLSFGAGVMLFFVLLGLLASRGSNILQYPAAIIALGGIVMALALSMLGVYTLQVPTAATNLEATIQQEGMLASFGKGALAPVLGFACTGPLLAGAFGWATKQPPEIAILAFLVAGLGMASPYMLLGANPNWLNFLPKPGNWMITFERIMGFLLLGMVLWLISPLVHQIGSDGLLWTLAFFVAVAMACWVLGKVQITMPDTLRWKYRGAAFAIVVVGGVLVYGWIYPIGPAVEIQRSIHQFGSLVAKDWSEGIPWNRWSDKAVQQTVRKGQPVFVDVTAAWCTVCKANKKLATNTADVRKKMESCGVVPFQADYTLEDPEITAALRQFDRAGPPLNLVYRPGRPDEPIVLDTNLTKTYLLEVLDQACREHTASTAGS